MYNAEKGIKYKSPYAKEHDVDFADDFAISESAVKKQARTLKSVIKLDKNFHIYIHGDRNLIEQGEDKKVNTTKQAFNEEGRGETRLQRGDRDTVSREDVSGGRGRLRADESGRR